MTASGKSIGTDTNQKLLRRLDIIIGLLAVVAAFLGVLVAHLVSGPFIPAFLVLLLFGLGFVALIRSVLE